MPRITDLIENTRKNSIRISALTLLDAAERQYTSNQIMEISSNSFECNKISNINNEDYQSCNIVFENNVPSISLLGSGKFKEYKCTGTKDNLYCRKIILVKVSIDLDGGTLDGNYNYAEDKEYLTLGIPEKENYDFDGWEVISGNSTVADNKVYIDGDTKLKAKWVLTPVVLPANATKYVSYLSAVNTSGLKVDDTDDKNIRYYGDDPNNYVAYNGEYWRIVGIFDVAKTIGGSKEKRVKIVRNGNLGNYSWDSTSSSDNSGYGYNVWETKDESSSSTLNILLNNYYYNSKNNQVCYNGEAFASVSCSFGSVGLDATARNLIDDSVWYLGGGSSTTINPKTSYEMERGNVVFADFADVAKTQTVCLDGLKYNTVAYNIDDNNYFKLRDIAKILDGTIKTFDIKFDGTTNSIDMLSFYDYTSVGGELTPGDGAERTALSSSAFLTLDGVPIKATCYNINDNNYFKLRDIIDALDCRVEWDEKTQMIWVIPARTAYDDGTRSSCCSKGC